MRNILHTVLCCLWIDTSVANDQERQELSRLLHELNYLDTIVTVARQASQGNQQAQFDYVALERGLTLIKAGITDYLNKERREPRVIATIQGSFTHGD